jgi:pyruvate kinase
MKIRNHPTANTKIICTLGPACSNPAILWRMVHAGMDAARLNFSHGTHKDHLAMLMHLHHAARATGKPVTIIQDLQGPKIRIGELSSSSILLKQHQPVTITTNRIIGSTSVLSTTYSHLPKDVQRGDRILLDDGKIELRVTGVRGNNVKCIVVTGGALSPHKGMNLPGVPISEPSLTRKDKQDLEFAFEHEIDYVALSFVRRSSDIRSLREYIARHISSRKNISIIAKIEKPEAINDIDAILCEADAVMVARGDLGVELPTEDVPVLQKMIVRKCNEMGKPVIIATQMLDSMIGNPRPTRAEANDVANAVLDGADAVMLSGETSVGRYPVETVTVMNNIIAKAECQCHECRYLNPANFPSTHPYDALCRSACALAERVGAPVIAAITHSGTTAIRVAKFRPSSKIIAVTDRLEIVRKLNLVWGIQSVIVDAIKGNTDSAMKKIEMRLLQEKYCKKGDSVVMIAGIPLFEEHSTNMIKVDVI